MSASPHPWRDHPMTPPKRPREGGPRAESRRSSLRSHRRHSEGHPVLRQPQGDSLFSNDSAARYQRESVPWLRPCVEVTSMVALLCATPCSIATTVGRATAGTCRTRAATS